MSQDARARRSAGLLADYPGTLGVLNVMRDVGNSVCDGDDAPLERGGTLRARVAHDSVNHLAREIEAASVLLEKVHHAGGLLVVAKQPPSLVSIRIQAPPTGDGTGERSLPRVPKGRVSQIVPEGDGLGEVLVQAKRGGHAAGNLRNLKRVREPRAVVVPLGSEKHLRLVREAPEALQWTMRSRSRW